jgi:hypothetical protein
MQLIGCELRCHTTIERISQKKNTVKKNLSLPYNTRPHHSGLRESESNTSLCYESPSY